MYSTNVAFLVWGGERGTGLSERGCEGRKEAPREGGLLLVVLVTTLLVSWRGRGWSVVR